MSYHQLRVDDKPNMCPNSGLESPNLEPFTNWPLKHLTICLRSLKSWWMRDSAGVTMHSLHGLFTLEALIKVRWSFTAPFEKSL